MSDELKAYRGAILHCVQDPRGMRPEEAVEYIPDGILLVEQGHIRQMGPTVDLLPILNPTGIEITVYEDCLLVPGFIDCHVHFSQLDIIASYGKRLLDWLERYTYPCEQRFADPSHTRQAVEFFLTELLRNGTTSAAVFSTVHMDATEALFEAAEKRHMRIMTGKVLMDRNAPAELLDTPESAYRQSRELIERWHGRDRLSYAVTPRFAPCCTDEELNVAHRLMQEFPDVHLQTHLAETLDDIAWARTLFPGCHHDLDVYDRHGLLGERALFAHAVHLQEEACQRLAESGSAVALCPSSNLFLGSGLFDFERLKQYGIRIGLGSDIGAGTSLSPLRTLQDAYKVMLLRNYTLDPFEAFYLATLGGARALGQDARIGRLGIGYEADFLVLDYRATPLLEYRIQQALSLEERLFALIMLGDDRVIRETFVAGESMHRRDA